MKPRVTVITLGVDDLERALRFYRDGLGLTKAIVGLDLAHHRIAPANQQRVLSAFHFSCE